MDRGIALPSLPGGTIATNPSLVQSLREAASNASSLEGSTQGSQDEKFTDSGYASRNPSCRGSKFSNPSEEPPVFILESKFFRRKSRTLHEYKKEIPRSTWDRFYALHELHGQRLLDSLSTQRAIDTLTKRRRNYSSHSVSTKLKVLGETEATAKPWVVVRCDQTDYRGVRNFYNQKHVIADYEGPHADADLPSLEVIIHPRAPVLSAANEHPGIYASWPVEDNLETLCGQVIRVSNSSQAKFATLGGIIKIATPEDEFMLYGLTVGHVFQSDDALDNSYNDEMESEEGDGGVELFCIDEPFELDSETFSDSESETSSESISQLQCIELGNAFSRVGHVIMTASDMSGRTGNLDWGLVEIDDSSLFRPNLVPGSGLGQQNQTKVGLSEFYSSPRPEENRPVLLLSGIGGSREGLLSTHPSFINLPGSDTFIETFNLSLLKGNKIQRGDCGSWVADSMTYQVYGHIVASDNMNEAYVVPLRAIFDQIKDCAGTNYVRLAKENDIKEWRSRHANDKTPVKKGAPKSHEVGEFAPVSKTPCISISSNAQEPKTSIKTLVSKKRCGVYFSKPAPVESSTQLIDDQSTSNWALSPKEAPSMLLTTPASNIQQSKLYTPPSVLSFLMEETQGSLLRLDRHDVSQESSDWARTQSLNDSDAALSPSRAGLHRQTENRKSRACNSLGKHEKSSKPPISPIEDLSSPISDQLHEAALVEYQRQYGTLAPWTEFPAQPALKSSGWDSGYSTAESANHSPAL